MRWILLAAVITLGTAVAGPSLAGAQTIASIMTAQLMEPNQKTAEVSTQELQQILAAGGTFVFDARPHLEWAISHVPGAFNVAPKPGVPMSQYVSDVNEVLRVVNTDKAAPIVLYCNGPFCGKSKRWGEELMAAGFSNVRRYQLGAPTWRALVGLMEIELDGVLYAYRQDKTAVFIDTREAANSPRTASPERAASRGVLCGWARTSGRSSRRRTTGACRWRTITPGSSSTERTALRRASSPSRSRKRRSTMSHISSAHMRHCALS